jgi:pyridoxamine-phosphate oxidase
MSDAPVTLRVDGHNQYKADGLDPSSFPPTPLPLFRSWLQQAIDHPCAEPEAIAFSTATPSGVPSTRFVLLKAIDATGCVIYTNYDSRKGRELAANPVASLATYWREQSRSVRVVGRVERLSPDESQAYFDSRPVGSRIGAWASPQSQAIDDRGVLEKRIAEVEERFGVTKEGGGEGKVPVPPFWGGVRVVPDEVEFWAGQPSRLHDRFIYRKKKGTDEWTVERLAP